MPPGTRLFLHGDCSIRINPPLFTREEIAACAERTGLLSIELELPTAGDCSCDACRSSKSSRSALAIDEIRDLLNQASLLGCRQCILLDGATQASPLLFDVIDVCRSHKLRIDLFSHGDGISEDSARRLRECGVHVALPLYSLDAPLNDRLSAHIGSFATVESAIVHLKRAGYGTADIPSLAIRTAICAANIDEIPALLRWVRAQGFEPQLQTITPRSTPDASPELIPPHRAKELFEALAQMDLNEFGRVWHLPASIVGRSNDRALYSCHVTACGTVLASAGIDIALGNVRLETLREILNLSEVLENLRAHHLKVKEPCKTCSKTVDCHGSRGAAFQLTGDYLAGDQLCWKAEGVVIPSLPVPARDMVPHGPSIRMVDSLTEVAERLAITEFTIPTDSFLLEAGGRLDELACIEMIAQSFAASHGFHPSGDEGAMQRGLLIGVKDVVISGAAYAGDKLKITVRKTTRFGDFGVIDGEVHHANGRLIATGQIKVWRPTGEAAKALMP